MLYSELKEYIIKEVIRDRSIDRDGHLVRLLNISIERMARDLNTIDPDFYLEEYTDTLSFGVPVNLGESLGFGGAVYRTSLRGSYGTRPIPRLSNTNKRVPYGIKDKMSGGDLIIELVNNSTMGSTIDFEDTVVFYSRKPAGLTGVDSQEVDVPEQLKYELGLLLKFFYYDSRGFSDEADRAMFMYKNEMNQYVKRKSPSTGMDSVGQPFIQSQLTVSAFR